MIGSDLPEGVTSKGKANTRFSYELKIKVPKKGLVSLKSNYDFLTNDLTLELKDDKQIIAASNWEIISDDEFADTENFSSVIEDIELPAGIYTVLIKQGIASNHLVQRYPDISSCFPFSFYAEFIPLSVLSTNTLVSVNPSQVSNHNVLQNLLIFLKFEHPVDEKNELESVFYLKSTNDLVYPDGVVINPNAPSKFKLKFSENSLKPGTCYELLLDSVIVQNDDIKHEYCTLACLCNPRAKAECVNDNCVCPSPYTGTNCFACIDGYNLENNSCMQAYDLEPKILATKFSTNSPVTKNQQLRVYVDFSSAPYDKKGEKVTKLKQNAIQDAFLLVTGRNKIKTYSIFPLTKGDTKWVLKFASEDLEYGKTYTLKVQPDLLFSSTGVEFSNDLEEISIETSFKAKESSVCNGHGIEKGLICKCDAGYIGEDCSICDKNYRKTVNNLCEENFNDVDFDTKAFISSVNPSNLQHIIQGIKIIIEIELSKQAYTDKGYIIDSLTNSQYMQNAFVIQKLESEKFIQASSVKALDKKGFKWEIGFTTSNLEAYQVYKLSQAFGALYTAEGKEFSPSKALMPNFSIFPAIDCNKGVQSSDYCICDKGYQGSFCNECIENYYKSLKGECILKAFTFATESQDNSFSIILTYCVLYSAIVGVVICAVNSLRKQERIQRDYEMSNRSSANDGIDLYK